MTDVGDELLEMCRRNVDANKHLQHSPSASLLVRELDWLQSDLQTGFDDAAVCKYVVEMLHM